MLDQIFHLNRREIIEISKYSSTLFQTQKNHFDWQTRSHKTILLGNWSNLINIRRASHHHWLEFKTDLSLYMYLCLRRDSNISWYEHSFDMRLSIHLHKKTTNEYIDIGKLYCFPFHVLLFPKFTYKTDFIDKKWIPNEI